MSFFNPFHRGNPFQSPPPMFQAPYLPGPQLPFPNPQTGGGLPPQGVPYVNTGGGFPAMPGLNAGTEGYDGPQPMPNPQAGGGLPPQAMGGQHRFGLDRMTRQGENFNGMNNRLMGRGLMR